MTHKTKGIVLRTVHYGETSVITSVYTELFGLQSYIVKGVRQATEKIAIEANIFSAFGDAGDGSLPQLFKKPAVY